MNLFKKTVLFIFSTFIINQSYSQVIFWSEDFNSYADGVTTGSDNNTTNPANDWTSSGCTSCGASPDDWWEIQSGVMEARDVNGDRVSLQTESIDIASFTGVIFNVDVIEIGDLEGLYLGVDDCADAFNQDYADVEYRIDGGTWILVPNYLGWCGLYGTCNTHTLYGDDGVGDGDCRLTDDDWGTATVTVSGLSGSTLEIRLSTTNFAGTEYIGFDNITVLYISALPIELISFNAEVRESNVDLNWTTASEVNNDFFTIERSTNGSDWTEISTINGAGNSQISLDYSITDERPHTGLSYYRLKQTDFDGKFEYSKIQSVKLEKVNSLLIYPNPATTQITIIGDKEELEYIKIINVLGQDVTDLTMQSIQDEEHINIDLSQLKAGTYYVKTLTSVKKVQIN